MNLSSGSLIYKALAGKPNFFSRVVRYPGWLKPSKQGGKIIEVGIREAMGFLGLCKGYDFFFLKDMESHRRVLGRGVT